MKLEDKGPIKPVPVLKDWAQTVSKELQSWSDIVSATHWAIGDSTKVNGADFYVNEFELGHIHLDGEMHLSLTKSLAELLIQEKMAAPFPWGESWVQLKIKDEETAKLSLSLFRIGYDRIKGTSIKDLQSRIIARK